MLEYVALWGCAGGLSRALAGFLSYGRPSAKSLPLVLIITGFLGAVFSLAVASFEWELNFMESWKFALVSGLAGYVGVDIINSLIMILKVRRIEL